MPSQGIYIWKNLVTGQVLVGQTNNFTNRKRQHLNRLERCVHANKHFQNSWKKHGRKNFEFIPIQEVLDSSHFTAYEQSYLDYYRTLPGGVYNQIGPADSPRRGVSLSQEHKCHLATLRRNMPSEQREHLRQLFKGRFLKEETKQRMKTSARLRPSRPHTLETKAKLQEAASSQRKPIKRYCPITGSIKIYDFVLQTKEDGFDPSSVVAVCKKRRNAKTYKGFVWTYLTDSFEPMGFF